MVKGGRVAVELIGSALRQRSSCFPWMNAAPRPPSLPALHSTVSHSQSSLLLWNQQGYLEQLVFLDNIIFSKYFYSQCLQINYIISYYVYFIIIYIILYYIMSYLILFKGLFTYYVSQKQGFLHPPSPLRQQWSAFGWPPLPPPSAMVSI